MQFIQFLKLSLTLGLAFKLNFVFSIKFKLHANKATLMSEKTYACEVSQVHLCQTSFESRLCKHCALVKRL